MSKLLQEAIADAKAVKALAIENAKVALAETFNREVTGLFQEKIKDELAQEEMEEQVSSGIGSKTGGSHAPKKQPKTKVVKQPREKFFEETEEDETPVTEDASSLEEDNSTVTDQELEEILNSLEEMGQEDPNAPVDPNAPIQPPVAPPVPTVPPTDPSATAPIVPPASAMPAPPMDPSAQAPAPVVPPVDPNAPVQPPVAEDEGMDEIDLDELLKEIGVEDLEEAKCEDGEEEDEEGKDGDEDDLKKEVVTLKTELNEHIKVIEYLRGQINEINLLNAKLLYTNKLFKQFGLNNSQKLNIVEKFDLTNTLREVKLTYTVLADQLSSGASTVKKTNTVAKSITEGLASKAIASTKPSKDVIVENTNEMALRFQKLAGIKK